MTRDADALCSECTNVDRDHWREAAEKLRRKIEQLQVERDTLRNLIKDIHEAVYNEGKNPRFHRRVVAKHRFEWPYLWSKIDRALYEYKKQKTDNDNY